MAATKELSGVLSVQMVSNQPVQPLVRATLQLRLLNEEKVPM